MMVENTPYNVVFQDKLNQVQINQIKSLQSIPIQQPQLLGSAQLLPARQTIPANNTPALSAPLSNFNPIYKPQQNPPFFGNQLGIGGNSTPKGIMNNILPLTPIIKGPSIQQPQRLSNISASGPIVSLPLRLLR